MSAKTKIVVLHRKELLYTGVFAVLGILLIVLLVMMLLGKKVEAPAGEAASSTESTALYIPGVYTTELVLGNQNISVEVIVDKEKITSIRLVNLSDSVTTMYPLLQPAFDSICEQVYDLQTLEGVRYNIESKYTSLVLLESIRNSLEMAAIE